MGKFVARAVSLVLSVAVIAGAIYVVQNRRDIQDWLSLQNYQPSSEIAALADATTMTDDSRWSFYASRPTISDKSTFNQHCTNTGEESIVLGCYNGTRIYLYRVSDSRLPGVVEVTAAHEMLHAAYDRLDEKEKQQVNDMLAPQIKTITDERILGLIEIYKKTEPGELYNEMHSILATEYRNLTPELETYYQKYFDDRLKVVGLSEGYEGVFQSSKQRIAAFDSQLENLRKQIETNEGQLAQQQNELEASSQRLNQLRVGNPEAYNQAVPEYNAQVRSYNDLLSETKGLVAKYNRLVEERNAEIANQKDLNSSLDSRFTPEKQQ